METPTFARYNAVTVYIHFISPAWINLVKEPLGYLVRITLSERLASAPVSDDNKNEDAYGDSVHVKLAYLDYY